MKRIILTLVALIGLMSYLSAQVEVGDGGSSLSEFEFTNNTGSCETGNLDVTHTNEVFGFLSGHHYKTNADGYRIARKT